MVKVKPDEDSGSGNSNSTIGGSTSFNLEGITGKDGKLLYRVKHCFCQILCIITIENLPICIYQYILHSGLLRPKHDNKSDPVDHKRDLLV